MTEELLEHVRASEECRLAPYLDPVGLPTIGYGHRIESLSHPPLQASDAEAILKADLEEAERAALRLAPNLWTEPRRLAALTDLIFNVGAAKLAESGTLRCLREGNWSEAAARFRKWNKGRVNGQLVELQGLTKRREVGARWIEEG
jgi:lysozyme